MEKRASEVNLAALAMANAEDRMQVVNAEFGGSDVETSSVDLEECQQWDGSLGLEDRNDLSGSQLVTAQCDTLSTTSTLSNPSDPSDVDPSYDDDLPYGNFLPPPEYQEYFPSAMPQPRKKREEPPRPASFRRNRSADPPGLDSTD